MIDHIALGRRRLRSPAIIVNHHRRVEVSQRQDIPLVRQLAVVANPCATGNRRAKLQRQVHRFAGLQGRAERNFHYIVSQRIGGRHRASAYLRARNSHPVTPQIREEMEVHPIQGHLLPVSVVDIRLAL
jgi:hypothetical protein